MSEGLRSRKAAQDRGWSHMAILTLRNGLFEL